LPIGKQFKFFPNKKDMHSAISIALHKILLVFAVAIAHATPMAQPDAADQTLETNNSVVVMN
jgi:hypothetical protein